MNTQNNYNTSQNTQNVRVNELLRQYWTAQSEYRALKLDVGESYTTRLYNDEDYNAIKIRLSRLKPEFDFSTKKVKNKITVTRK